MGGQGTEQSELILTSLYIIYTILHKAFEHLKHERVSDEHKETEITEWPYAHRGIILVLISFNSNIQMQTHTYVISAHFLLAIQ